MSLSSSARAPSPDWATMREAVLKRDNYLRREGPRNLSR
jgi:hypothetical protein